MPLDAYSSTEIEAIADEVLGQTRRNLLDDLRSDQMRNIHLSLAESARALDANADRVRTSQRAIQDLTEQAEEFGDVRARLHSGAVGSRVGGRFSPTVAPAATQSARNREIVVERKPDHFFALFSERERLGDGFGARVLRYLHLVQLLGGGERERAVFHGANAVETPSSVGDGLNELALDRAERLVVHLELIAEGLVGLSVLGRKEDGLAGEAVAQSVEAGALFAFRRTGSGGLVHGISFLASGDVSLIAI